MSDTLKTIQNRHSTRVPFDPNRPITPEILKQILEAAKWAPTGHNMQNFEIIVIEDKSILQKIGNIKTCVLEEFLRDNLTHLSFSDEELKIRKTGILATGFPSDWVNPEKISQVAHEAPPIPLENNIRGSPTLLMVLYDPTKKAPATAVDIYGFMSLGCLMENIWLAATTLDISVQILSLSATAPVEKELKQILGIPDPLKIAFTVRLGYPINEVKLVRVRRDIEDFSYYNKYRKHGS